MIRSQMFRGVRYSIKYVPHLNSVKNGNNAADCEVGDAEKVMRFSRHALKEDPESEMTTYVHEALHACFGDLDEDSVETAASDIAQFLKRLGYRKVD